MKIKLFYSYSRADENHRKKLVTHLTILRDQNLIHEWHGRKIDEKKDWNDEIQKNMEDSDIILFLFSPDFLASTACKKEIKKALELKEQKGTILIPIILRACSWKSIEGISNIQALPLDAKPIKKPKDQDQAWQYLCRKIKAHVKNIKNKLKPTIKNNFRNELLKNPVAHYALNELFVYPNILETSKLEKKLENNEIDSSKLRDIQNFQHSYILIEGKEQIGKTSLCNILCLNYIDKNFYPILINGESISGKADIEVIVNKAYQQQYNSTQEYWQLDKAKRILLIDDINNRTTNNENYTIFLKSIRDKFEYAVILIDELCNLADKSTEHNYFYRFNDYSIKPFGHKKRDELIKKCIANGMDSEFNITEREQMAKLNNVTNHINAFIRSNTIPSYPIIIISSFNLIESRTIQDMEKTSYAHCYHAMITIQLYRANIKSDSMNEYFNLLTELAYCMFNKKTKEISKENLSDFLKIHKKSYIFDENMIKKLVDSHILATKNNSFSFQYVYIYYYFVAKYISGNFASKEVKEQFKELIEKIHKKDNSNIVTFITHHAVNDNLNDSLSDFMFSLSSAFKNIPEATLEKKEIKFLNEGIKNIEVTLSSENQNVEKNRNKQLDKQEKEFENNEDDLDLLSIEILKSAKSIEIIGHLLKNQYETFKKNELIELFQEGQKLGFRLMKYFIKSSDNISDKLKTLIQERLLEIKEKNNSQLSKQEIQHISQQLITQFLYVIIIAWLFKIVNALGYYKLITIADNVNNNIDTPISQLINFSIHAWYQKNLDIYKLNLLYKKFSEDKNYVAQHILKNIISSHLYMHKLDYKKKERINALFGFSIPRENI